MLSVFLGDSFTQGENNKNISFADYMACGKTVNLGVSGTTIGEYSIYPVDGNSLLSLIFMNQQTIKQADRIFIEYGINDASSCMSGFVKETAVRVSFVKAIDLIKQLNDRAEIYFLALSVDKDIINDYAKLQCEYLCNDYFKGYDVSMPVNLWASIYSTIVEIAKKRVPVLSMIPNKEFLIDKISDDKIHPNDLGYFEIARNISKQLD